MIHLMLRVFAPGLSSSDLMSSRSPVLQDFAALVALWALAGLYYSVDRDFMILYLLDELGRQPKGVGVREHLHHGQHDLAPIHPACPALWFRTTRQPLMIVTMLPQRGHDIVLPPSKRTFSGLTCPFMIRAMGIFEKLFPLRCDYCRARLAEDEGRHWQGITFCNREHLDLAVAAARKPESK